MFNALSVDLEDWYHVCGVEGYSDPAKWDDYENRITRNTGKILSLLDRYNARATFFVLGYIAAREPSLIREITARGHEIATHGFCHRRVFEMTEHEFEDDVKASLEVLSSVTNERVIGFRAPEWSIRKETPWAFDVLRKLGILYDSSMVPLTRMGSRDFPLYPTEFDTGSGKLWEFPLSTIRLFAENIPFSGGLPLRMVPYFYIASAMHGMNRKGIPAIAYIHPWEFDTEQPVIELPTSRRFMHYFNIGATPRKIEGLLRHFSFAPVREVLGLVS
ncbi:MAG TPA: polysaccharide deacetylase family protein [Dissulfurispiraceae bacterium]|nr:polysaccharide deacetylase family protein [Dissulfurispiraceae bacterium]